jgi:hypothetical protein
MIKKYSYLNNLFKSPIFYITLITSIFFAYIIIFANVTGDWRHFIDSEIVWPYNVLLILSNKQIDFSAYGFFYFIIELIFFQILDLIGFLKTTNIGELNNSQNFSEKLENLVFAGRWFNIAVIYLSILITYLIFNNLIKNSKLAFLLVLIFMITPGMIQAISYARVDILSSTLFFISYFFLIKFTEKKNSIFFILFIIFFFLSVFTKVQSYLFLFALLISSSYFLDYQNNISKDKKIDFWIKILILVFILYCLFYPLIFHRHAKFSLIFLYSQLVMLSVYLYFVFKDYKSILDKNIIYISYTFIIILIFIFIINNLSYMYLHAARLTFFEPMEMRMYLSSDGGLKGADVITLDIKKNLIYFFTLFKKLFNNIDYVIVSTITKFNSNTLLIGLNIIIVFYYYFFKKIKKDIFLLIPVLCFLLINCINHMRGQPIQLYLTFSEFFLFIPICIYLNKADLKIKKLIIIFLVLILTLPPLVNSHEYNQKRYVKNNNLNIWCPGFLYDYTKKISQKQIKKICN